MSKDTSFGVEYKFPIESRVTTPLGATGVITMLGFDHEGKCYHVAVGVAGHDDRWWYEAELKSR